MHLPKWAWYIIAIVIVLVIFVIFKINVQIGQGGFHITQGIVG